MIDPKRALLGAIILFGGCKSGLEPNDSPLLELANRLYLEGEWAWTDSTGYRSYLPAGDSVPHTGWYVFGGTATIEPMDSVDTESYIVTSTARLDHVDSTLYGEMENWYQDAISYTDTVLVRGDTVFGLFVAPIPPEANANTDRIRWEFGEADLWCTNWLDDLAGDNPYDTACSTVVHWRRTAKAEGGGADSTAAQ